MREGFEGALFTQLVEEGVLQGLSRGESAARGVAHQFLDEVEKEIVCFGKHLNQ
jgi:hypothetical protein